MIFYFRFNKPGLGYHNDLSRHQQNQGVLLNNNSNATENVDFNGSSSLPSTGQVHAIRAQNGGNFYPSQNNNLQRVVREEFTNVRSPNEPQKGFVKFFIY